MSFACFETRGICCLCSIRFLEAHFHAVDGNFQQSQKLKPMDLNDRPLTQGAGFWVEEQEAATFVRSMKPPTEKEVSDSLLYSSLR